MKRMLFMVFIFGLMLSACMPALPTESSANIPTPISEADLQGTAAILSQMTLQAIPTETLAPTQTPIISTPTNTPIPVTATETPNPFLLTLTATLGTGTVTATTGTPGSSGVVGTLPSVLPTNTLNSSNSADTPQPLTHGTLPPALPSGLLNLFNRSHVDAYISLRCVSKGGYVTILEYPVSRQVLVEAPAGNYTYVAWVGGREFQGSFSLKQDDEMLISLFADRITIK